LDPEYLIHRNLTPKLIPSLLSCLSWGTSSKYSFTVWGSAASFQWQSPSRHWFWGILSLNEHIRKQARYR